MNNSNFVYWKNKGNNDIYCIKNPNINEIGIHEAIDKGFVFYPFSKSSKGLIFKGKIEICNKIEINNNLPQVEFEGNDITQKEFSEIIEIAISKINSSAFDKVVLARSRTNNTPKDFNLHTFFKLLCENYINSFVYCLKVGEQIWIGASPELLLKNSNGNIITNALAGTVKSAKNVKFGNKEIKEQGFVKEYILDLLKKNGSTDIFISENNIIQNGTLLHILNEIMFKNNNPSAILTLLHPTPAVCGLPYKQSFDFIVKNEKLKRSFYSGFLGWVDSIDNFEFWVNLRCATISKHKIRLYAGAGITAQSNAEKEWIETENKMKIIGDFL